MFDWKGFKAGRVAVYCDNCDTVNRFLSLMREHGLVNVRESGIKEYARSSPVTIRGIDSFAYDVGPDWYLKKVYFGVESVVNAYDVIDYDHYNFNESEFLSLL